MSKSKPVTPSEQKKKVEEVLKRAEDTLATANLGLAHVRTKNPKERVAGIRNVIVFGRAVTNVLQNIRSIDPGFDEWYQKSVKEMEADPLMKFFYKARSEILKKGTIAVSSSVMFSGNPMEVMRRFKAPPRAKGFFFGDPLGGSGWEVETEDGTIERYYVEIPENAPGFHLDVNIHLLEAPEEFRRLPVADLCERYLTYMSKLIMAAKSRFL